MVTIKVDKVICDICKQETAETKCSVCKRDLCAIHYMSVKVVVFYRHNRINEQKPIGDERILCQRCYTSLRKELIDELTKVYENLQKKVDGIDRKRVQMPTLRENINTD